MAPNGALRRIAKIGGAGGLLFIAGMHAGWAAGFSWPAPDERSLARAVIGREEMPSSAACLAAAGMLFVASALIAGYPKDSSRFERLRKPGVACVVGTLVMRGIAGAFGILPPQRTSGDFARWDRRLYSPLCLVLALLCGYGGRTP